MRPQRVRPGQAQAVARVHLAHGVENPLIKGRQPHHRRIRVGRFPTGNDLTGNDENARIVMIAVCPS
ncbi:hypothetical protein GCM10009555_041640 [Acrocarpospora macrocephala]